jgi:hypothetical protein
MFSEGRACGEVDATAARTGAAGAAASSPTRRAAPPGRPRWALRLPARGAPHRRRRSLRRCPPGSGPQSSARLTLRAADGGHPQDLRVREHQRARHVEARRPRAQIRQDPADVDLGDAQREQPQPGAVGQHAEVDGAGGGDLEVAWARVRRAARGRRGSRQRVGAQVPLLQAPTVPAAVCMCPRAAPPSLGPEGTALDTTAHPAWACRQ